MKEFDKILPVTEIKRDLLSHVKSVQTMGHSIAITRNGKPAAVLVSVNEYEGLLETIEILSDQKLLKLLKKSIKELDDNEFVSHEEVWS
ncbi:MAG: type II toxin-antitoxin system Phd/YefM family antitoxin [bacterium]|nr:type II toxin-antitoxin system Phd/YefM family antitoxin [bacterium]MBU1918903.1 type II toxin-antitoxin system Phd/YefM family antitoxin [bacterium]